ncbi:MAG TPA: hypothetical protein VHV77_11645 [Pirellulales bacterium]|jgi:energy-coupling factor transporter ATP-binding protein EcfA2|nr:hypothetical protein [Pirellulales bacterium]
MSTAAGLPHTNPFATRRVRPGAIEFQFPSGCTLENLAARFEAGGGRGQIVGPHGSGKSTLIASLASALTSRGYELLTVTLHAGQRRLPCPLPRRPQNAKPLVVVIDGNEQLGRFSAWWLRRTCARRGFGLLVTTHRACTLPLLYTVEPSLSTTLKLFEHLLPESDNRIASADVEALYARHRGNVREVLFGLYDLYEARRSAVD